MSSKIAIRDSWFLKVLRVLNLVEVDPEGRVDHSAGADFVEDLAFRGGYDAKSALSSLAAFPWPFACVQAISTDLSKVPITVHRGSGADAEVLDDHPFLDLIKQPSTRVGGTLFRRQLYTDLVLTGNAFILIGGTPIEPLTLIRLHPSRVSITPLSDGQPNMYQYDGGEGVPRRYTHEQVMHIRSPSWSDDPSNLWGTGCVQPLHNDLTTEMKQSALTARTASTGQPTGILSPKEDGDRWSKEQITTLRSAYENQMKAGGSGVLILGGQAQFDKVSFTPREMEFSQVRDFVRSSTLAAFDVPPARVGLPNTNYATALAQSKRYWEGLQGRAALIDAELTRLARMWGDETITVRHDFSGVDSLQESRSERLQRVLSWSMLGVPLADAAAYEGFDDLPFTPGDQEAPVGPVDSPDEVDEQEQSLIPTSGTRWLSMVNDHEAVWRAFIDEVHAPTERAMQMAMLRYLRGLAARIAKRLPEVLAKKAVGDEHTVLKVDGDWVDQLVQEYAEGKIMSDAMRGVVTDAFKRSIRVANESMPQELVGDFEWDPPRLDKEVEEQLASLVTNTTPETKNSIRKVVQDALSAGGTIGEMQSLIMKNHSFDASRALRIARTETTKSVNAGGIAAWEQQAADAGVGVEFKWQAQPGARAAHKKLNNVVRGIDGFWESGDAKAKGPGQFEGPGEAGLNINCRCTFTPRIIR